MKSFSLSDARRAAHLSAPPTDNVVRVAADQPRHNFYRFFLADGRGKIAAWVQSLRDSLTPAATACLLAWD
jgi:hypothetical protein